MINIPIRFRIHTNIIIAFVLMTAVASIVILSALKMEWQQILQKQTLWDALWHHRSFLLANIALFFVILILFLESLYFLTYRICVFDDRIQIATLFGSKTIYWNQVEKFYFSIWFRGSYVLKSAQTKITINTTKIHRATALLKIIEGNINTKENKET